MYFENLIYKNEILKKIHNRTDPNGQWSDKVGEIFQSETLPQKSCN